MKIQLKQIEEVAIVISAYVDNVAVAKMDLSAGTLLFHNNKTIELIDFVQQGQRFSLCDIEKGESVRQYGYSFGQSKGIPAGKLVTNSNIINKLPKVELNGYKEPPEFQLKNEYSRKTFLGYKRKGRFVGTRNYYLIIPLSMCASETASQVASFFENDNSFKQKYTNIDGIISIPHTEGCGCGSGMQINRLISVLKGYALHPNVGACLIIDLGCEQTNMESISKHFKSLHKPINWLTIQECGGTDIAIKQAQKIIMGQLNKINEVEREDVSIENLVIGTECGASDSFSGITANPIIGNAIDRIIAGGGSAILSEIPEMVGTFEMLLPRFRTMNIALKFKKILDWYIDLAKRLNVSMTNNLVAKNIEGGLVNSFIKSLGAVMKGGSSVIEDVIDYASPLTKRGLSIMQGPGNDLESVTGMVASGATIICFSTGKGTITGNAICPVIKIASNATTFEKLSKDMDFDVSRLCHEKCSIEDLGLELFNKIITVASGEKTWSEKWKQRQFQVWTAGKLSL